MEDYKAYKYTGPVTSFGKIISEKWTGVTRAVSENKARNNLIFQFKKANGQVAASKIELPGKIERI